VERRARRVIRYYDKEAKKNVDVGADFTFILLDQLASVRGWHDDSNSGIYSNEVKDTTQEALVVKARSRAARWRKASTATSRTA
jgi:hypothetical protein